MTFTTWLACAAASSILLIIPGPTALLVVSYALGQGWRAALPMAIGVALGDFTAMSLTMLGVGAVLEPFRFRWNHENHFPPHPHPVLPPSRGKGRLTLKD